MVLICNVEVAEPPLAGVTEAGEAEQVVSAGMPLQENTTAALNPPTAFTVRPTFPLLPATTVTALGLRLKLKSPPPPVSCTAWGLVGAESVIVRAPVRVPVVVGVKITLMVHDPPFAATVVPQLLVSLKSPVATMLVIVKTEVPGFESVTVCTALLVPIAWLANERVVGERLAIGAPSPVPSRATV